VAETSFDLIVIGGGPGGYVAAIRAAQLGQSVCVVEREHMGGICLNWGCIPTKALLRTAEVAHLVDRAGEFGIKAKFSGVDLEKVVARSRGVANRLSKGISSLMKKNKIAVFDGTARLDGLAAGGLRKVAVEVAKENDDAINLTAKNVILATGARARTLPGLEPDGKTVVTYKEAMVPKTMPKKLLVIGSGAIGIEFASFYNDLGADVTVVEVMDRVLPVEDSDISAMAEKSFKKQGMTILTSTTVKALKVTKGKATATFEAKGEKSVKATFDRVILAVGITGNVENLGLEKTRARIEKGHIAIDKWGATAEPGVYAIGDVAGPPWLAHKASHEGVACVEHIANYEDAHPLDTSNIPGCTYCRPQVASVGLTEAAARDQGFEVKVGRFPFMGNGKAIALGETDGMIKTVFDAKTGALLGAHMIGAEVTELIQGFALARTLETTEAELMRTVFPHPTLSEMMHESVLDAHGRVIHM
jgi:dihydrolipoamide dehydrogenase